MTFQTSGRALAQPATRTMHKYLDAEYAPVSHERG